MANRRLTATRSAQYNIAFELFLKRNQQEAGNLSEQGLSRAHGIIDALRMLDAGYRDYCADDKLPHWYRFAKESWGLSGNHIRTPYTYKDHYLTLTDDQQRAIGEHLAAKEYEAIHEKLPIEYMYGFQSTLGKFGAHNGTFYVQDSGAISTTFLGRQYNFIPSDDD